MATSIREHRAAQEPPLSCPSPTSSEQPWLLLYPQPLAGWLFYRNWVEAWGRAEERKRAGGREEGRRGQALRIQGTRGQDSDLHPCCGSSGGRWFLHLHSGSQGAGFLRSRRKGLINWPPQLGEIFCKCSHVRTLCRWPRWRDHGPQSKDTALGPAVLCLPPQATSPDRYFMPTSVHTTPLQSLRWLLLEPRTG